MKRLVAGILVFLGVIAAVVLLVPDFRFSLIGLTLAHRLQTGASEPIHAMSLVSSGTEIRPLTEEGLTVPTQSARPESYDLRFAMQETVESTGAEEVLGYRVTEVRSEQLGTTGGEGLLANSYRMRGLPTGLVADLTRRDGKPSRVLDEGRFSELLAAFWPELPRARVRPGATWTGRWHSAVVSGLLKDTPIQLQHRLRYTLVDIRREADLEVARIQVAGNIVPAAAGQVPPGTVVTGTGRVEGTTLVDLATGRTVLADDRTAWSVVVRLEGQNIEVVHFSDRKSRIWRPRLVPDGQAGFEAPLPLPDGGVPGGTGAPAQASPVPGASPKP
jgi:hypothetical protein